MPAQPLQDHHCLTENRSGSHLAKCSNILPPQHDKKHFYIKGLQLACTPASINTKQTLWANLDLLSAASGVWWSFTGLWTHKQTTWLTSSSNTWRSLNWDLTPKLGRNQAINTERYVSYQMGSVSVSEFGRRSHITVFFTWAIIMLTR